MKITKYASLNMGDLSVYKHVRSDLANEIEKYWVGRQDSNIGVQFVSFKDGRVKWNGEMSDVFDRKDIFMVQLFGLFNAFVEVDGSCQIDEYGGCELTEDEKYEVRKYVATVLMVMEKEYVDHERRFLESKPWRQCDGLTPEQAVAKLRELGW